ncbi:hydroxyacid dehydrogenase [Actinoplanes derwentensis]|uniref:Phosphoglycerate dehydrogenase n=1 Tax=Actinoplanes derwentensis TaxID=113562 RepID=A0A1H1X9V9_9ACTN|nr:hydroxyacid dehydrogenase [Actinoplanes derwentensis]GID89613.1 glycerate dehydrogenase [Actinoplanes derwentensis]SDT06012.1 Phosphoglycerate dehydrogenase [Actinoplanes derwentensis]
MIVVQRPVALFAMRSRHMTEVFTPDVLEQIGRLTRIDPDLVAERFDEPRIRRALAETEVLITGWGCPPLDAATLAGAPRLRAVLHAAGSVKAHVTQACWDRGLTVSSAAAANAIPVAEYALAAILFAGKGVFTLRERYRDDRVFTPAAMVPGVGNFGQRVGIIGASRIGRRVLELLHPFDLDVYLADPYVTAAEAADLGATLLPLDDLLRDCAVVSVHAPSIPETHGLLDARRLALLPDGAVLINTARGEIVDTAALTVEVGAGRISAVLDVTDPEPVPSTSPLFDLPGVFLTPHVSGSHGNEIHRLGQSALDELRRYVTGRPLAHRVHEHELARSA